jgi:hypothetical protein
MKEQFVDDIPNLIRTNNYHNKIQHIKNYEDTLQKLFKIQNNSSITSNPYLFLWKVNNDENNDFFEYLELFDINAFGINNDNIKDIVISGPSIRKCIVGKIEKSLLSKNVSLKKEIFLYKCSDSKWNDIINNFNDYIEKENEFVYEYDDKKIFLIKKIFKSPSHVALQHDYLKRIIWQNGTFYVSSMFLIEYQKHKPLLTLKFKDPILNIPYDPFGIFYMSEKNKPLPYQAIDNIDIDELNNLQEKQILKLYNDKTLIEHCMDKYIKEDHPLLINNLEQMLVYLSKYKFKRDPFFYGKLIRLDEKDELLFNAITNSVHMQNDEYFVNYKMEKMFTVLDINLYIISHIIKEDDCEKFFDFVNYFKIQITKNIVDKLISANSIQIINQLLKTNNTSDYLKYYLILMTNNISYAKTIQNDVAIDFLKDIISNGAYDSFMYLLEIDDTIISTTFEHNKNILHVVKPNNNYKNIIDVIMKSNPELIYLHDEYGEMPLFYHAKHNPDILFYLLDFDIDMTHLDQEGNTCLHHLCKHNETKLLKKIFLKHTEIIDFPNLNYEYPATIAAKNKQEEMVYIFFDFNVDMTAKDTYGNTPYHYICSNSLCLGIEIPMIQNYFGLTPKDYCKISHKYYNFIPT